MYQWFLQFHHPPLLTPHPLCTSAAVTTSASGCFSKYPLSYLLQVSWCLPDPALHHCLLTSSCSLHFWLWHLSCRYQSKCLLGLSGPALLHALPFPTPPMDTVSNSLSCACFPFSTPLRAAERAAEGKRKEKGLDGNGRKDKNE